MKEIRTKITLTLSLILCSIFSQAGNFRPAIAYDFTDLFDKGFNQAVYEHGALKFTEDTNIKIRNFIPTNEINHAQGLERLAIRGYNPIFAISFMYTNALVETAKKYPETQFIIIDSVVDLPNVKSILFKEQEGSFLVGALAALKSKSHKVGFVGGMDIPVIRRFACGYEQGAKYIDNNTQVFQDMTGWTTAAWSNPERGAELARSQFVEGADIIFAAAGGTGLGVYQAAKEEGKYAIGVDSNQNHLYPGVMLSSMLKTVGAATYRALKDIQADNFTSGVDVLGLKENGVDWALDEYNRALVTPKMEAKINSIKAKIISGEIKIHDYMEDNSCLY
ncbi:BMP family lipoprotein [Psychromonas antarctica]|jgi:basic membrane protein A|uniref:BMP family lipoprotein n=1 Tax=Psychromonas antarctica TaxID=67573 RepID=UPI001EE9332F|nr:BMP family ABC transporter substrate-binding protein [Psychromonas antarctica]MCG6201364.1 BMP family ABC transporter substrate-binding protein [Psychromonas antarctica]